MQKMNTKKLERNEIELWKKYKDNLIKIIKQINTKM